MKEKKIYLIQLVVQTAFQIMEDDDDYNDKHNLKLQERNSLEKSILTKDYFRENEEFVSC